VCLSSEELSTRMCHSVGYNQHSYGKQVSVDFERFFDFIQIITDKMNDNIDL
jgi:hypothetical protein